MAIGLSLLLIAAGAILAWGVNAIVPHANLYAIGLILLAVGALGLVINLAMFLPRGRTYSMRRRRGYPDYEEDERTVVDRDRY